jgi:hypothetical protein
LFDLLHIQRCQGGHGCNHQGFAGHSQPKITGFEIIANRYGDHSGSSLGTMGLTLGALPGLSSTSTKPARFNACKAREAVG